MKIFPIKLSINLRGVNQALYLKNLDDKIELEKVNDRGQRCTVFEFKKTTAGYMKLWFWQNKRWLTACCAIMVTACVSFYALRAISTPIEERLYNRYYDPFNTGSIVMFNSSAFNEARERYEHGDAKGAWYIMENLPDNCSMQKEIALYKALSLMEMGHYREAVEYFRALAQMPSSKFLLARAKWYEGLCHLKTRNFKAANDAFSIITPDYKEEYKKAKKILHRLEKQIN